MLVEILKGCVVLRVTIWIELVDEDNISGVTVKCSCCELLKSSKILYIVHQSEIHMCE